MSHHLVFYVFIRGANNRNEAGTDFLVAITFNASSFSALVSVVHVTLRIIHTKNLFKN